MIFVLFVIGLFAILEKELLHVSKYNKYTFIYTFLNGINE